MKPLGAASGARHGLLAFVLTVSALTLATSARALHAGEELGPHGDRGRRDFTKYRNKLRIGRVYWCTWSSSYQGSDPFAYAGLGTMRRTSDAIDRTGATFG